jgi:hypothetical protein
MRRAFIGIALALASMTRGGEPEQANRPGATTGAEASLEKLSSELSMAEARLPELNRTMSDRTDENVSLQKESAVYLADQKQKLAEIESAKKEQLDTVLGPRQRSYNESVANYAGRCLGRRLSPAEFSKCSSEKAELDTRKAETERWWESYAARWNEEHVGPANSVIAKQNTRLREIDAQIKANFSAFTEAQDRSLALRKRIVEIESIFRARCKAAPGAANGFTAAEALRWCHSVNWDGASTRLTPMYTYQGTGGAANNR